MKKIRIESNDELILNEFASKSPSDLEGLKVTPVGEPDVVQFDPDKLSQLFELASVIPPEWAITGVELVSKIFKKKKRDKSILKIKIGSNTLELYGNLSEEQIDKRIREFKKMIRK